MEGYMTEVIKFGGYTVDGIEWLDDDTACLYFEDFNEGDKIVSIVVEKWLEDNSWHFMDNYFAENGYFINSEETTHLDENEQKDVMEFLDSWIESWNE